jgi:hypothetical protein
MLQADLGTAATSNAERCVYVHLFVPFEESGARKFAHASVAVYALVLVYLIGDRSQDSLPAQEKRTGAPGYHDGQSVIV